MVHGFAMTLDLFPAAPYSLTCNTRWAYGHSKALLHTFRPLTPIHSAIRPGEGAFATFGPIDVTSLILGAIGPLHGADAIHCTSLALPTVDSAIRKGVNTFALHLVIPELSAIDSPSVGPVLANAILHAMQELALVCSTIGPNFRTSPSLAILLPLSFVGTTVALPSLSLALCPAYLPLTLVNNFGVLVVQDSMAMNMIVSKLSFVSKAIWSLQDTIAMLFTSSPLASVFDTAFKLHLRALLQRHVGNGMHNRWFAIFIFGEEERLATRNNHLRSKQPLERIFWQIRILLRQ
mmetsp:Transcript_7363/g.16111  ORF Transcript_7363/g.16111 Transcript_7363/m.16111 type:complete len:292 (-) Transcript_7363:527-1402(-)